MARRLGAAADLDRAAVVVRGDLRAHRRSGTATRSIGRRDSEASPISVESKGCAASSPMNRRMAVPALPMSSGLQEAP